jgi:hypothetical protein
LFDPPLDPGMLVKAAAAGIDIASVVAGLNQPLGPMRSPYLVQKALELATEVRSLGTSLLSAIEKGESERLALLRQTHEIALQTLVQNVRFLQWKHTQEATNALLKSRSRSRSARRTPPARPDPDGTNAPDNLSPNRSRSPRRPSTISTRPRPRHRPAGAHPDTRPAATGAGLSPSNTSAPRDQQLISTRTRTSS